MALNHIVNGSPVEVKHINYGTSVGYTVVGSPTISNGVVSGFAENSYLTLSNNLSFNNNSDVEFFVTFTTPSSLSDTRNQYLIAFSDASGYYGVTYTTNGYWEIRLPKRNGSAYDSYPSFQANTTYSIKSVIKNNGVESYLYDSAGTQLRKINFTNFTGDFSIENNPVILGRDTRLGAAQSLVLGSIDLNRTYIKKEGKLWFFRPSTNYLVKDDKLVFADSGLYLSGPVNYTVQGSPTIVDGVASGFSSDNYLKLQNQFGLEAGEDFEFFTKFVCPNAADIQNSRAYLWGLTTTGHGYGEGIHINDSLKPIFSLYTLGGVTFDYTLTAGNSYYLKAGRTNGQTYIGISTDNSDWTVGNGDSDRMNDAWTAQSASELPTIGRAVPGSFSNTCPFPASIDLNNTYIKKGGSLWFYGKNYASPNIAPVPSGLTYGNTTTSDIGWVDIRTQAFTAVPGATLGKDE